MDWSGTITAAATIVTALGGLELIKFLLNRKTNRRIAEANAFDVQREALMEDYRRVQEEVDKLKEKVDELYAKVHQLENERLDLINENNKLRLALKEAEKHVCLQPDDRCLQRLNPDDKCRLRKLLREGYLEDNPGAIVTEDDMGTAPTSDRDRLCVVPEERADDYFVKID